MAAAFLNPQVPGSQPITDSEEQGGLPQAAVDPVFTNHPATPFWAQEADRQVRSGAGVSRHVECLESGDSFEQRPGIAAALQIEGAQQPWGVAPQAGVAIGDEVEWLGTEFAGQCPGLGHQAREGLPSDSVIDGPTHRTVLRMSVEHGGAHGAEAFQGLGDRYPVIRDAGLGSAFGGLPGLAGDAVMRLDQRVNNRNAPFNSADGEDRQAACFRQVPQSVGVIPLALAAQPGDAVRRDVIEHAGGATELADPVELIEKPVRNVRVRPWFMRPEPDEAGDRFRWHRVRQQRGQTLTQTRFEPRGDASGDDTFCGDQGIGAQTLDGARRRGNDFTAPQFPQHGSGEVVIGAGTLGRLDQPGTHLLTDAPFERQVAVDALQSRRVLIPRRFSGAVVEQGRAGNAQLPADERKHGLGNNFARLNQTTRVAKGTEWEGESEPVLRPSASTDMRPVLGTQLKP